MKCHFGEFNESVLKALRDAYNPDANSFAESCDEFFDFTQCQRSDGTIYGSRGDCAQKGAKEVTSQQGNTAEARKIAEAYATPGGVSWGKFGDVFEKMDDEAKRNTISLIGKKGAAAKTPQEAEKALNALQYAAAARGAIAIGEGKKVPSITSIVPQSTLDKIIQIANNDTTARANADSINVTVQQIAMQFYNRMPTVFGGPDAKAKAKPAPKPAAKPKPKAAPKPKAKAESRYSYEDNRKQYKQFYNMVRNQGLGHGDAAGAAEDAMKAKGFDTKDISNQYRKEVREAF